MENPSTTITTTTGEDYQTRMNDATEQLESFVTQIKDVSQTFLNELDVYIEDAKTVKAAFVGVQQNAHAEAHRLEEVAPDVEGVTERFIQQYTADMILSSTHSGDGGGLDSLEALLGQQQRQGSSV
jgi:hypothetical protein